MKVDYLFDCGFDQQTRQQVGEVPALLGLRTGLGDSRGVEREPHHASFVLYFFHFTSHKLTYFQIYRHEQIEQDINDHRFPDGISSATIKQSKILSHTVQIVLFVCCLGQEGFGPTDTDVNYAAMILHTLHTSTQDLIQNIETTFQYTLGSKSKFTCLTDEWLTMPAFTELEVRALFTSFGLTDSWMLIEPPFATSSFATTHLITMPGEKRWGREKMSCKHKSQTLWIYGKHPGICVISSMW